jgi:hypothetical protein
VRLSSAIFKKSVNYFGVDMKHASITHKEHVVAGEKRITPAIAAQKSSLSAGAAVAVLQSAPTVLMKINGASATAPPGFAQTVNASI